ncbi:uncharacterized protein HMPREF1541_09063 [Cyphellophora europaea CBS 101466]|uniref:C2H2-type domain-containing protein n=1 Tax=Cyphellophora europaea (strain CBS 101466) TaxID=1220924 RepID=W2RKB9_CYPE1|nr:uncharacterized protein HMPREF1541_09063 [Cyphellophora europaea CBS 101466]ETN36785.1 hypothetical protein HMPREF1541_09063 [Cyphellophora europaea CBS 101466]
MKDETLVRRRARQARLREKRSFHIWAATATADLVQKPIRPLTDVAYSRMLQEWDFFASESEHHVSPLDVATLKKFLKWYCDGRKGRLTVQTSDSDEDQRITQDSAYSCWKSFMSAWHRRSGDTFSKSIQNTIETLIYGGDGNWLNLRTARRPTRNFTLTDFQACVRQLWQNDWYDFRCEAYRVGLHQMMLMHTGTSARSAEYVMNLRYRDTLLYQVWFEDRPQPQLVIDLCRNHTKGLANLPRQQPEHLLYELVDLPFYYNTVAFFVAGLLAVQGLRNFDTWSGLCAVEKPPDRHFLCLDYTDDVLDRHVYARYNAKSGGETKAATSLVGALGLLGQRAGFRDRPTPGAIRREALLQVDRYGYSINERMRHADHRNANTYGGYYQNAISTVDGQATYFGLEQQLPVLHELFRGFSIRRDYQFRPEVPLRLQSQMNDTRLVVENDSGPMDRQARQKIYDGRRRQRDNVLRADQQRRSKESTTSEVCAYESDFQQARRLMPERDRLAESLFQSGSLRDAQGIEIMKDLVALFSSRNSDTYCVELNSSRSRCDTCGVVRPESTTQEWWRHVYHCRKGQSELAGGFTDFCFLCFAWFDDMDAWNEHNKQHSQNMPLKCSLAMFRGTVLRPAWCPDCTGKHGASGEEAKGLTKFLNVTAWKAHVDEHIHGLRPGPYKCAHPRCSDMLGFSSMAEYLAHRSDIHLIPPPNAKAKGAIGRVKRKHTGDAVNEASYTAKRPQLGLSRSSSRSSACAASEETSTPSATDSSPEPSSPRSGREEQVLTEEGDGNGAYEEKSAALAAMNAMSPTLANGSASPSWSASSSSLRGQFELPESGKNQYGRGQGGLPGELSRIAKSRPTTIEVVIPAGPQGWDDVPLVRCVEKSDDGGGEHTIRKQVSASKDLDEPQAGDVGRLLNPPTQLSPSMRRSKKGHVDMATSSSSRSRKHTEVSEAFVRRRNAISEMHARIQERRKSRLKKAAVSSR